MSQSKENKTQQYIQRLQNIIQSQRTNTSNITPPIAPHPPAVFPGAPMFPFPINPFGFDQSSTLPILQQQHQTQHSGLVQPTMQSPFFPSFGPTPMSHSSNVNMNCLNMRFESGQFANQSENSNFLPKNVSNSTNSNNNVSNFNSNSKYK